MRFQANILLSPNLSYALNDHNLKMLCNMAHVGKTTIHQLIKKAHPSWMPSITASTMYTTAKEHVDCGQLIMSQGLELYFPYPSTPFDPGISFYQSSSCTRSGPHHLIILLRIILASCAQPWSCSRVISHWNTVRWNIWFSSRTLSSINYYIGSMGIFANPAQSQECIKQGWGILLVHSISWKG